MFVVFCPTFGHHGYNGRQLHNAGEKWQRCGIREDTTHEMCNMNIVYCCAHKAPGLLTHTRAQCGGCLYSCMLLLLWKPLILCLIYRSSLPYHIKRTAAAICTYKKLRRYMCLWRSVCDRTLLIRRAAGAAAECSCACTIFLFFTGNFARKPLLCRTSSRSFAWCEGHRGAPALESMGS